MMFTIFFQKQRIGTISLDPDVFEAIGFSDPEQERAIRNLIGHYYREGIVGGAERDSMRTTPLRPDDQRFALELAPRLHALGYDLIVQ